MVSIAEKFITDVAVAANEKVKEFIKKKYERSLDEHLVGEGCIFFFSTFKF